MSKGSAPRPRQVSREEYERRWGDTFPVFDGRITNVGEHPVTINGREVRPGETVYASVAEPGPDGHP